MLLVLFVSCVALWLFTAIFRLLSVSCPIVVLSGSCLALLSPCWWKEACCMAFVRFVFCVVYVWLVCWTFFLVSLAGYVLDIFFNISPHQLSVTLMSSICCDTTIRLSSLLHIYRYCSFFDSYGCLLKLKTMRTKLVYLWFIYSQIRELVLASNPILLSRGTTFSK